ncbi:MAG TPA: formyltransferase family protein, partial [Acidimicrobiia bacterium]|nr:formyltransferase family protein [Acidimicrobiia bacterium]
MRPHIVLVASDNRGARSLDRAEAAGIPTAVVEWQEFGDRDSFSAALADEVEGSGAKGVVLAGFMRILAPVFLDRFPERV